MPCAQIVEERAILDKLVRLLVVCEGPLTANKNKVASKDSKEANADFHETSTKTPKWLAPLLLLIDRLEKVAILTKRKQLMHKVNITRGILRYKSRTSRREGCSVRCVRIMVAREFLRDYWTDFRESYCI